MNITQSVWDKKCPTCQCDLSEHLKALAHTENIHLEVPDDGVILCQCGAELDVRFGWAVVWSEVVLRRLPPPKKPSPMVYNVYG